MTMNLHDAVNGNGLFDVQGKIFKALADLNTAAGSTVPTSFNGFSTQYAKLAGAVVEEDQNLNSPAAAPIPSWQSSASTLTSWARTRLSQLLAAFVNQDALQPAQGDSNNLAYLLAQMKAGSDYLAPNTVTTSLSAAGGNSSTDLEILHTPNRGDGLNQQHSLAEAIAISISSTGSPPGLQFLAPSAASDKLDADWPLGSGANFGLTATDPSASLLPNGNFETDATINVPDGWLIQTGTPGGTVKISLVAVQTVTISGTPTAGYYVLTWLDPNGVTWATSALPYNASGSQVQAALRTIPGLGAITVSSSGTSPNLTHTITFTGVAGDINTLGYISQLTGGAPAIATATTTHGDAAAYKGQALIFASNGSELTAVYSPALTLSPETVYFCGFRSRRVGATAAGQVAAEIVGSIGGAALSDDQGNANQLLISATAIATASADFRWFAFRLPASQTGPVYLRLRISTAVDNGVSIYWDEAAIVAAQELYAGGPFVAALAGKTAPRSADAWTLTVANDRAGVLHEWYNRAFDLAGKRLLLPATGSNLIPNSVVS